ncbi:hypothetical protein DFH27DRAFT_526612 [Peziza echinospora]|nr:hypothetical protein DFH27DRAFT_526612 [Peziza echinospora]
MHAVDNISKGPVTLGTGIPRGWEVQPRTTGMLYCREEPCTWYTQLQYEYLKLAIEAKTMAYHHFPNRRQEIGSKIVSCPVPGHFAPRWGIYARNPASQEGTRLRKKLILHIICTSLRVPTTHGPRMNTTSSFTLATSSDGEVVPITSLTTFDSVCNTVSLVHASYPEVLFLYNSIHFKFRVNAQDVFDEGNYVWPVSLREMEDQVCLALFDQKDVKEHKRFLSELKTVAEDNQSACLAQFITYYRGAPAAPTRLLAAPFPTFFSSKL